MVYFVGYYHNDVEPPHDEYLRGGYPPGPYSAPGPKHPPPRSPPAFKKSHFVSHPSEDNTEAEYAAIYKDSTPALNKNIAPSTESMETEDEIKEDSPTNILMFNYPGIGIL